MGLKPPDVMVVLCLTFQKGVYSTLFWLSVQSDSFNHAIFSSMNTAFSRLRMAAVMAPI